MLRHLELIDDEASQYGVKLVKIDDALMAKKYGHRDPPGLGFFRKGNYVKYDGKAHILWNLKPIIIPFVCNAYYFLFTRTCSESQIFVFSLLFETFEECTFP